MTRTTCDKCNQTIVLDVIKIEVNDGVHPHNGDEMTCVLDFCGRCAAKLSNEDKPFRVHREMGGFPVTIAHLIHYFTAFLGL